MQFVNDDMDNLFRKAAEDYQLSTDSSNWDDVQQKLDAAEASTTGKNNRNYWWLLLLLPIMFICNRYENKNGHLIQNKDTVKQPSNAITKGFKKVDEKEKNSPVTKLKIESITAEELNKAHQNSTLNTLKGGVKSLHNVPKKTAAAKNKKAVLSHHLLNNIYFQNTIKEKEFLNRKVQFVPLAQNKFTFYHLNKIEKNFTLSINADSLMLLWKNNNKKNKKEELHKRWYAGFVAAPDISFVKSTKTNGVGNSYGLVAGYRLNSKWSIETGFQRDKKNYYSTGEYFKSTKTYLPNHATIIHASGSCYMTELPLNIRYQIAENKNSSWVIAAGTSSYFMKKENYNYLYERYGTQYYQYKKYNNKYNQWLSVINLSAGVNKPLGRLGTLRLEPYVKIPIKGIGIGQLPVTSSGINIGLTKQIN